MGGCWEVGGALLLEPMKNDLHTHHGRLNNTPGFKEKTSEPNDHFSGSYMLIFGGVTVVV